jgi:capsular polysaccharide transport system permease protein
MGKFGRGWGTQRRVIGALMVRELLTRFGRENIGFLWIMVEPLLFALLVGVLWRFMKGPEEHGVSVVAFVASGYIPLTLFRNSVNRSVRVFSVNSSLMYHRQIKVLDFITVRFLIEMIGGMMAYLLIGVLLLMVGEFPAPADYGWLLIGWLMYSLFTFSLCLVLAPLSEWSDALEKIVPVATYVIIPFSGAFNMKSWLTPQAQDVLYYSPFVHAMEMMRHGLFGSRVDADFDLAVPLVGSMVFLLIGLAMCRRVRRRLVVE